VFSVLLDQGVRQLQQTQVAFAARQIQFSTPLERSATALRATSTVQTSA